ncbi:menaquinone biosynthesis protein [Desulfothermus okinawensis JCM 13304]
MDNYITKIKLGKIGYLNVLPIYYPLEKQIIKNSFEVVEGIPARLNELMSQGKLDISGTSSIEYGRNFDKYLLIPDICIGSNGPVMSVLFLSKIPIKELSGKKIVLTAHSHTSVTLLKIYLRSRNIEPEFVVGDVTKNIHDKDILGALAIGDEALHLRGSTLFPHVMDMGEEWRKLTGLPFVFGVWVVNKKSLDKIGDKIIDSCKLLLMAKNWGKLRLDMFARIVEDKNILNYQEALSYFKGLIYDMNIQYLEGLKLFYKYSYENGLIDRKPEINLMTI